MDFSGGHVRTGHFPLFSCERYPLDLPAGHPFPHEKYPHLESLLAEAGFARFLTHVGTANRALLATVHDEAYLDRVFGTRGAALSAAEVRRLGFPWAQAYLNRALSSVEATFQCMLTVLQNPQRDPVPLAGALAGGTHHAYADHGEGYCTFNDIAVAARYALAHEVDRVLVVDLDAHQGNGTASIFRSEPRVFTFSMHCEENYPRPKEASSLDIGLARGAGDEEYLRQLEEHLPTVVAGFAPELAFFQTGVDVLAADRFGRLGLSLDGLRRRDECVLRELLGRGIPTVLTLGGGYQKDALDVARAHAQTYTTAARVRAMVLEQRLPAL